MHVLFIDESGTPPKPSANFDRENYFVIGGAIIHETAWHRVKNKLLGLKARLKIRGELKWRYFAPGNEDDSNPLRGQSQEVRDNLRSEVFNIISSDPGVTCLACISNAERAYKYDSINNQEDLYHATYKPVTERFQYFLQDLSKITGRKEYGIIVSDHRGPRDDKNLRKHHDKLIYSSGEFISRYENLIESLFFQPSNLSVGIQLADMVAGAVWRKAQKQDERWFDLIKDSFRKSENGQISGFGLIEFPKRK